jgi:hypothetical protein
MTTSNARRSYARPKPTRYHVHGYDIELVPENPDNQKWRASRDGKAPIGHYATLGAAERGIRAARTGA